MWKARMSRLIYPNIQLPSIFTEDTGRSSPFCIKLSPESQKKSSLHSVLEEIPGIGEKRRKTLIKHFGTIEAIKNASLEELASVEGMNRRAAQKVLEYLKL